ncbi:DUF711 family protein, partial [Candidatus Aerophobetes bacterium]
RMITTMLLLGLGVAGFAQAPVAEEPVVEAPVAIHTAFKIRTITAGINVTQANYREELVEAMAFLEKAKAITLREGFLKHGTRISTNPWPEYTEGLSLEGTVDMIADMVAMTRGEIRYGFAIGPGIVDDVYDIDIIQKILAFKDRRPNSTIVIATKENGIHYNAVRAAAKVIKGLSEIDVNFPGSFAAIANTPSEVPFFPGAYHDRPYNSFTIGTQGASIFMDVSERVESIQEYEEALWEVYEREMKFLEKAAYKIEAETGWKFEGIDTTPAQMGEISIGKAVENLIGAPFGSPGTLAVCGIMTSVIKGIDVKKCEGYLGLFLPTMEDRVLAERAYDYYGLDSLLAYSGVSGTGLDVVAIPGDVTLGQLEFILLDIATMALKLDKALTGRLYPIPGKKAGEIADLGKWTPQKIFRVKAFRE